MVRFDLTCAPLLDDSHRDVFPLSCDGLVLSNGGTETPHDRMCAYWMRDGVLAFKRLATGANEMQ